MKCTHSFFSPWMLLPILLMGRPAFGQQDSLKKKAPFDKEEVRAFLKTMLDYPPEQYHWITGSVHDQDSGESLYGCVVQLLCNDSILSATTTDFDGKFNLYVLRGTSFDYLNISNRLELEKDVLVSLNPGDETENLRIEVKLAPLGVLDVDLKPLTEKSPVPEVNQKRRRTARKSRSSNSKTWKR